MLSAISSCLEELSHVILRHFHHVQNYLEIEGNLKMIVNNYSTSARWIYNNYSMSPR